MKTQKTSEKKKNNFAKYNNDPLLRKMFLNTMIWAFRVGWAYAIKHLQESKIDEKLLKEQFEKLLNE